MKETGLAWFPSPFNIFFLFYISLHHCKVTHKNNYLIYTHIFFIYSRVHISCVLKVSIILSSFTIFISLNEFLGVY